MRSIFRSGGSGASMPRARSPPRSSEDDAAESGSDALLCSQRSSAAMYTACTAAMVSSAYAASATARCIGSQGLIGPPSAPERRPSATLPGNISGSTAISAASGSIASQMLTRSSAKLSNQNMATATHIVADSASANPKRHWSPTSAASRSSQAWPTQARAMMPRSSGERWTSCTTGAGSTPAPPPTTSTARCIDACQMAPATARYPVATRAWSSIRIAAV